MWTRTELKQNAKNTLRTSYWESLAVILLSGIVAGVASLIVSFIPLLNVFSPTALVIFVSMPLSVGMYFFFMQARLAPPVVRYLFHSFESGHYMSIVGAMAWMYLFLFLWSVLPSLGIMIFISKLVISGLEMTMAAPVGIGNGQSPFGMYNGNFFLGNGLKWNNAVFDRMLTDPAWITVIVLCSFILVAGTIIVTIKQLSYSMTPFILTDNPEIGHRRALRLSIEMMHGQKWRVFVLYLSFIGWYLLSALTLFIGALFLTPYVTATQASLYVKLREHAIDTGLCTAEELNLTAIE